VGRCGIARALCIDMKLSLAGLGLVLALVGCAAPSVEDQAPASAPVEGTNESDFTSGDRKAQLEGLRARVQQDFAGAKSLESFKLVFVVRRLNSDTKKAVAQTHIMKRDAQGKDHELADADYEGSVYEETIAEGLFDGPEVTAILQKNADGKWSTVKKGSGDDALEAYVVGPTDVAYEGWDREFGVPRAWLFGN
jgi:hypothetical protein